MTREGEGDQKMVIGFPIGRQLRAVVKPELSSSGSMALDVVLEEAIRYGGPMRLSPSSLSSDVKVISEDGLSFRSLAL